MRRWVISALAFVALAVPSMAHAQANALRIALQPGILFLPLWIMKQESLIEKRAVQAGRPDLNVSWLNLTSGGANIDALLSGNVDIVSGGVTNLLVVWARSRGVVKAVSAISGVPNQLVTRDPAIRTLKDFSDKNRIAVPTLKMSTQAVFLQMALEQSFGADSAGRLDALMVQLGHSDAAIALSDSRSPVDTHFSGPPFLQTELKQPGVRSILSSVDVVGPATTLLAYTSTTFYDANPRLVKILIGALDDANAIIEKDPAKAAELYLLATREKYTNDEVVQIIKERGTVFTIIPNGTMQFAEFMRRVGLINQEAKSWKDYFFPIMHSKNGS